MKKYQDVLKKGISVIICCYNSAWIIERCLNALIKQRVSSTLPWEIIIVNNASTDNTKIIAQETLYHNSIKYKIVDENTPGLLYARKRGVKEAQYSYLIFCDDDNLLNENYVASMYNIMETHPNIGAYGGKGIAEFESLPDNIILKFISSYAIGSQRDNKNFLFGAGLCTRKDITEYIYNNQRFYLTGRCSNKLLAGDDSELVKSIILKGYSISFDDNLTFTHVLTSKRLTYKYLCELFRGFGITYPILQVYDLCIDKKSFSSIYSTYICIFIKVLLYFPLRPIKKYNILYIYLSNILKGYHIWNFRKIKSIYTNLKNDSKLWNDNPYFDIK